MYVAFIIITYGFFSSFVSLKGFIKQRSIPLVLNYTRQCLFLSGSFQQIAQEDVKTSKEYHMEFNGKENQSIIYSF